MVEINRVWINVDTDTNKIILFGRPRVSIRVDEYIWSLIEEHIVKPHKLMRSEKHRYLLKISFHRFDPVRHRYDRVHQTLLGGRTGGRTVGDPL